MRQRSAIPVHISRIGLRLPPTLRTQLEHIAVESGMELSAVVRAILGDALAYPEGKKMAREMCKLPEPGTPENEVCDGARMHSTADVR
jgi:hypothetical protein